MQWGKSCLFLFSKNSKCIFFTKINFKKNLSSFFLWVFCVHNSPFLKPKNKGYITLIRNLRVGKEGFSASELLFYIIFVETRFVKVKTSKKIGLIWKIFDHYNRKPWFFNFLEKLPFMNWCYVNNWFSEMIFYNFHMQHILRNKFQIIPKVTEPLI